MKKVVGMLVVMLALFGFFYVGSSFAQTVSTGVVLVDGTTTPISGAHLSNNNISCSDTDNMGQYICSGMAGSYNVKISADYFIDKTVTLNLPGIKTSYLLPAGHIQGVVTHLGTPLNNATVSVTVGTKVYSATSNAGGAYLLKVPGGVHDVKCKKTGYTTEIVYGVSVVVGRFQVLDFDLM